MHVQPNALKVGDHTYSLEEFRTLVKQLKQAYPGKEYQVFVRSIDDKTMTSKVNDFEKLLRQEDVRGIIETVRWMGT